MMHPILIEFGEHIIHSYSFFMTLAWLTGITIFLLEAKRLKWHMEKTLLLLGSCLLGAALGATGLEVLFLEPEVFNPSSGLLNFSGKTVLGGLAGGFMAIEYAKKKLGFKERTGDAFALAIPVAHSVGRLGCLLGGCCYGTPTSLPWGVHYPEGSLPYYYYESLGLIGPESLITPALHPAPLYEVLANLIIIGIILWQRPHTQRAGSLFRLYLFLYTGFRFFIEFLRADTDAIALIEIKPVQFILFAAALYFGRQYYLDEIKPRST